MQNAVQGLAQRQGAGAHGTDTISNSLVGKNVVPDGITNKTTGFKQWSRRYKLVAGAKDDRFKSLLEWAEMREPMAPSIVPDASGIHAPKLLGQHVYASLLMSTEAGTEVHSIVGWNVLEACRRLVQRFDPASAQANLNLLSRILKSQAQTRKDREAGIDR